MLKHLRAAFVLFLLLSLLTGVAYPAFVTLAAQAAFPRLANGSVLERDGKAVGSALIGQSFDAPHYFWGRPSATSPMPHNAASSSGSNLGPTNPDHSKAITERVAALKLAHPDQSGPVPGDLVTTSASGLDPHISPAAAEYQVSRVAKARGMSEAAVRQLVSANTEGRFVRFLGEPGVNVLQLNLALDQSAKRGAE